ncbi:MAG: glycosyltransferase family 2 protein [Myxococcales bacterium]|nr:glycosyltransferase family 2 protein [Myxococcales bacterium]
MNAPAVSCLLPVRDAASTLGAALRSVLRQTDPDFECLVLDDGSRDASVAVAQAAAQGDSRIRVHRLAGAGIVAALNAGLALARAPLIARMDADDLMHSDRFALQRAALARHPDWVATGSHVRLFPRPDVGDGMRAYEHWLNSLLSPEDVLRDAFVECPVAHPTWLLRREAIPACGYRDRDWPEDYDLFLRLLQAGGTWGVVPRRLLSWRQGATRLSRVDPRYRTEAFTACRAAFLATGPLARSAEFVLWGYGGTGRALCRALRTLGRRPSHIVEMHPRRLGNRIQGALVVAPARLPEIAGGRPIVVSVAGPSPREEIRRELERLGFRERRDFFVAA